MRSALKLLLPLFAVLGLIAWGATVVAAHTGRRWFDRDMRLRAQLAIEVAREGLEPPLRKGERVRVRRVLLQIARDERVMGAAACSPDGGLVASTPEYPKDFGCAAVALRRGPASGAAIWSYEAVLRDGRAHVTAVPLADAEGPLGFVILVHDMSWVDRREAQTRRFLAFAFAAAALAAAVAALATALAMPREVQRERMRAMRSLVAEFNVYRWAGRMLVDGGRLRRRDRVSGRLTVSVRSVGDPAAPSRFRGG